MRRATFRLLGLGAVLGLLAAALTGCAREREPDLRVSATVGDPGPDAVRGVVRQVGSTPFSRYVVADSAVVTGPMEEEVARLAGAEVELTGRLGPAAAPFGPELEVTGYRILSVDGEEPAVGVLRRDEDGWTLEGPEGGTLALSGVSGRLASAEGGRVWVVAGEGGTVRRYGILRPPSEMPAEPGADEPNQRPGGEAPVP